MALNDACIVGIGESDFYKRAASPDSELALALQAIVAAAQDAGIDPQEIDGLVSYAHERNTATAIIDGLGLRNFRFSAQPLETSGGGTTESVSLAAMAVASGRARYVAVYRSIRQTGQARLGRPGGLFHAAGESPLGRRVHHSSAFDEMMSGAFAAPYGISVPVQHYALEAQRHMHEYGTTSSQLGVIAVNSRRHGSRNPKALRPDAISLEDHQASRVVASPLRLLDCCMESDNAGALIVTTADVARDLRSKPVRLLASAYRTVLAITTVHGYAGYPSANLSAMAADLWARSGLKPSDIDVAQLYDAFTIQVLMAYEDLGFCKKGEGGPFVEGGAGAWPGGQIPTNTSGGMLAEAYVVGMNLLIEAVRQIRGTSTCQVPDARTSLVAGGHMGAIILGSI